MEGTHRKLCTRLSDRLRSDNSNCLAHLHRLSCGHVGAVTFRADSAMGLTGKNRTNLNLLQCPAVLIHTLLHDEFRALRRNHMVRLHQDISVFIYDILTQVTSCDTLLQTLDLLIAVCKGFYIHSRNLFALLHTIYFVDNQLLRYIHQTSGQVS